MDEEKKIYSIVGKVEIGTDEYRDLIEQVKDLEKDNAQIRQNYWETESKNRDLTKKVKSLEILKDNWLDYLEIKNLKDDFDLFVFNKTKQNNEEE